MCTANETEIETAINNNHEIENASEDIEQAVPVQGLTQEFFLLGEKKRLSLVYELTTRCRQESKTFMVIKS